MSCMYPGMPAQNSVTGVTGPDDSKGLLLQVKPAFRPPWQPADWRKWLLALLRPLPVRAQQERQCGRPVCFLSPGRE